MSQAKELLDKISEKQSFSINDVALGLKFMQAMSKADVQLTDFDGRGQVEVLYPNRRREWVSIGQAANEITDFLSGK